MAAPPAVPAVGSCVKISTVLGETFSGFVFAYDAESKLLMIEQPGVGDAKANVRLLRMGMVSSCTLLEAAQPSRVQPIPLPAINRSDVNEREKRALTKAHEDAMRIGNGVTVYGQAIFDAICKTMPCEWDGQARAVKPATADIVVLNEVRIPAPYLPEGCQSVAEDKRLLERVRKVLAGELYKLKKEAEAAPLPKPQQAVSAQ